MGAESIDELRTMILAEMVRLGVRADHGEASRLANDLEAQDCEYGEIGVMAACIGFSCAKGRL